MPHGAGEKILIKVFRVKAQSKLVTGVDGPFDTEEISEYLRETRKASIVGVTALDEVTLFIVVSEPDK